MQRPVIERSCGPRFKVLCFLLFTFIGEYALSSDWPEVTEFQAKVDFDDAQEAGVNFAFKDVDGNDLYMLSCHSGFYEGDPEMDYSGLLSCMLRALYSVERFSNLLAESGDQVSDWENRGRFLESHLSPGCVDYPDWGKSRSFRLRGMRLVLAIDGIEWNEGISGHQVIRSYSFSVAVHPDASARLARAEQPDSPEPSWFYTEQCGQDQE